LDRLAQELAAGEWTLSPTVEELFADHAIQDEQVRMMFSCCHPRLSDEAQVALILQIRNR
jgi:predicted RNA polymerase sigma factor